MKFENLVGQTVEFYGVDCNTFCIKPKDSDRRYAFEAMEDVQDGYRSMMEEIAPATIKGHIFFGTPIASVIIQEDNEIDGYRLIDTTVDHIWLRFGTDHTDTYYPCFTFEYNALENAGSICPNSGLNVRISSDNVIYLNNHFLLRCPNKHQADVIVTNLKIAFARNSQK